MIRRENCARVCQLFVVYSRYLPRYHQHVRYTFQTKPVVVRYSPRKKNGSQCTSRLICNIRLPFSFLHIYNQSSDVCTILLRTVCKYRKKVSPPLRLSPNLEWDFTFWWDPVRTHTDCGGVYSNWPNGVRAARTHHKSSTRNIELPPFHRVQSEQNNDRIEGREIMDLCNQIIGYTYRLDVWYKYGVA